MRLASMKPVIRASALAVAAFLMSNVDASAQTWGRPQSPQSGACFYEHIDFGGDYFCTPIGSSQTTVTYRMNNRISSIRLFGNAEVTVYMDQDFRGRSRTFGSNVSDLRQGGWNDRVSSYHVRSTGRQGSEWAGRWGRAPVPSSGVCFYEHIDFQGQYFCVRPGERIAMVPEGTNDRISSIRLIGDAELTVYLDRDFSGASRHFATSARDLRESGWNDTLSSFRVEMSGGFGRFGRGQDQGQGQGQGQGQQGRGRGQGQGSGTGGSILGSTGATGQLEWRGRVDDRLHLAIRGNRVEHRTVSGTPMRDGSANFTSGLPAQPMRVTVSKLSGRGQVRVIQQPARTNDFTAIVEIFDEGGGSQEYRITVTWR